MFHKFQWSAALLICALSLIPAEPATAAPASIAIQGKLERSDQSAVTGIRKYRVRFYNALTAGTQLGGDLTGNATLASSGRFTLTVIPPSTALSQTTLFYELAVDSALVPDGAINLEDVFPTRIQVQSVPFALRAANADQLGGVAASNFWRLGGNTGTNPATQFLGTNDAAAFELRAGGSRALRVEPGSTADISNIILGSSSNQVEAGVDGGTIGGGGAAANANFVGGNYGTVGGGNRNQATGALSTVSGGRDNVTTGTWAVIGGGLQNIAPGNGAFVGGGVDNQANGINSVVGGGVGNAAGGGASTIPGGQSNLASGSLSFAAGNQAQALHTGTFAWGDSTPAPFASTGINQFLIRAGGGVGINKNNPASALDVNGDIRFSGRVFGKAVRTDEAGLRLLRGTFNGSTGAVHVGSGATCVRNSAGFYSITYTTSFASAPTVFVTPFGGSLIASVTGNFSNFVNVLFVNSSGTPTDPSFVQFMSVGP